MNHKAHSGIFAQVHYMLVGRIGSIALVPRCIEFLCIKKDRIIVVPPEALAVHHAYRMTCGVDDSNDFNIVCQRGGLCRDHVFRNCKAQVVL